MGLLGSSWNVIKGTMGGGYLRDALGGALGSDKLLGEGSGRLRGEQQGLINQQREAEQLYGGQASDELQKALAARTGGFDQALEATSGLERQARREAVSQGNQLESDLTQKYGAGGKFGTTALENARMGLHSALSRDLESIDSGFAGLFSQLATGRGEAEAAGRGDIASLAMQRGGQEAGILQQLMGTLKPEQKGMLSSILGLVGAGAGAAFGGPAGGQFGGEAGSQIGSMFERT